MMQLGDFNIIEEFADGHWVSLKHNDRAPVKCWDEENLVREWADLHTVGFPFFFRDV